MKEKHFVVECHYCDVEVEIYCETDMVVEYCPFCGADLNYEWDDDEEEDYEDR